MTRGSPGEVFAAFLKLGLTSFGGPIAHLGYFRDEFVERRKWLVDRNYAELVALCQFLPGPASSQVGFALGLYRAGPLGALAAFTAFTLPSTLLLIAFAFGATWLTGPPGSGILAGLKIVAVAIVAQAVWGMARSLCPDRQRATIALVAVLLVTLLGGAFGQIMAIATGALAGLIVTSGDDAPSDLHLCAPVGKGTGIAALGLFTLLLLVLPVLVLNDPGRQNIALFDAFYRSGALVFGGGHVVLPMLEAETVQTGWVTEDAFLAGYGAAQAVPGPLFTFAAYLGAVPQPEPNGVTGAVIALIAIFLPGFLLLIGILPFWQALRLRPAVQAGMRGANAAVVGILGAALYSPLFTSAITTSHAFALALAGFVLLVVWKIPPWIVVALSALGGILIT